ncbi:hypothetical protein UFOVP978_41 [uncultured Caudovirales phage]|uniref:Uncharacterized protein n=1 Tax=uncultured Caudovirales phage TaxID=2100421 RepID=A0A6J5PXD2_9CAUD|nr:hypothetical protein UFOVP978_41 [uncultured Caudovirales phage]
MIEDFNTIDDCLVLMKGKVERASRLRMNIVPGFESDDIRSEMFVTLLQVWKWGERSDVPVQVVPVFWTAWNRRLIRLRENAKKRYLMSVYCGHTLDLDDAISNSLGIDDPLISFAERLVDLDPEASVIARMRAEGFLRSEIMEITGISRREYYRRWQRVIDTNKEEV